ncbi:EF-hand domain-containing protein 1 [Eumeta japonica]|uniref:EF-hand domain-containing protein 1 n=1 Tax=Eumeta variegata TaxID=151549 RepID=A0A4C1Y1Z3_EUMVA|nr:EF-hand domain-containing protein 1 [Eumeta japonica]
MKDAKQSSAALVLYFCRSYDPSMTYGRVRQPAAPAVVPHWVHYDKRCLRFKAFMRQSVFENPDESYRTRFFDIFYFLEDDTMLVIEPRVKVRWTR